MLVVDNAKRKYTCHSRSYFNGPSSVKSYNKQQLWNPATIRIQNPSSTDKGPKSGAWNLESGIWNPQRGFQNPRLSGIPLHGVSFSIALTESQYSQSI